MRFRYGLGLEVGVLRSCSFFFFLVPVGGWELFYLVDWTLKVSIMVCFINIFVLFWLWYLQKW